MVQNRVEREKQARERAIIDHAQALFFERGYERASMDELSRRCEYTKRTIYRYFAGKEDLYFAVMLRCHEPHLQAIREAVRAGESGYEKIGRMLREYFNLYREQGPLFDLMRSIKTVSSPEERKALPYFKKYEACVDEIYIQLIGLFQMAARDGSIRRDRNPVHLGLSTAFVMSGFLQMLSIMGGRFVQHFSLDEEQFSGLTMDLILEMIRPRGRESEGESRWKNM